MCNHKNISTKTNNVKAASDKMGECTYYGRTLIITGKQRPTNNLE